MRLIVLVSPKLWTYFQSIARSTKCRPGLLRIVDPAGLEVMHCRIVSTPFDEQRRVAAAQQPQHVVQQALQRPRRRAY
jgi:hypothetical protein